MERENWVDFPCVVCICVCKTGSMVLMKELGSLFGCTGKLWCHFLEGRQRKHRDLPRSTVRWAFPSKDGPIPYCGTIFHPRRLPFWAFNSEAPALHGPMVPVSLSRGLVKCHQGKLMQCRNVMRWNGKKKKNDDGGDHKVVTDLSNRVSDTGRCPWLPADLLRVLLVLAMTAMSHSMYVYFSILLGNHFSTVHHVWENPISSGSSRNTEDEYEQKISILALSSFTWMAQFW